MSPQYAVADLPAQSPIKRRVTLYQMSDGRWVIAGPGGFLPGDYATAEAALAAALPKNS